VADREPWQTLLCEALAVLALPPDEQVRANGPGCVGCDLGAAFDHARTVTIESEAKLSDSQRQALEAIHIVMRSMQEPDVECFNNDVLRRPVWQRLRDLSTDALRLFGWERAVLQPFVEVEPGIWRREPIRLEDNGG
jgi:hypothetical protein